MKVVYLDHYPSEESKMLAAAAKCASRAAIEELRAHNLPITFARDGDIIRLYPNGEEHIIGKVGDAR